METVAPETVKMLKLGKGYLKKNVQENILKIKVEV